MKRFISIFNICLIAIFLSAGCSTTGKNSPADKIGQIKDNYFKCKDKAILNPYFPFKNKLSRL